ncbi:MAG: glycosyltransferase [Candidatus Ratteibacteria bacterium]
MSKNKKKVLYITYHFPPSKKVGAIRARGFAKYLPEFGWHVIVLTTILPDEPEHYFNVVQTHPPYQKLLPYLTNPELRRRLKSIAGPLPGFNGRIYSFFRGMIDIPDSRIGWLPFAVSAGKEIIKKEKPQAIVSNFGPATCHIVASYLKKIYPEIFWLADFRDPWTQFRRNSLRTRFEKSLEKKVLERADALSIVSEYMADRLKKDHPDKRVFVIPNGFDPEEISTETSMITDSFTITYTGSMHPLSKNPSMLFEAINNLVKKNALDKKDIKINFYGPDLYWVLNLASRYSLRDIVQYHGTQPRHMIISIQRKSQILLILTASLQGEEGTLTAKIFEYLAARRPIISIGEKGGEIEKLLIKTQAGNHCQTLQEIEIYLVNAYKQWKQRGQVTYMGIKEELMRFSHIEMAKRFVNILEGRW